ncbi:MAG: zinc metallopeptidase, partial [Firmicutes bacterium]|nr:zinc metallopeptidase [Bacillota bacterium]
MAEFIIIALVVGLVIAVSSRVNAMDTFRVYGKRQAKVGITAAQFTIVAIKQYGMSTQVVRVSGYYTDFFSKKKNIIALSQATVNSTSIAALAVAAHEFGHACQADEKYLPYQFLNFVRWTNRTLKALFYPILLAGLYYLSFEYKTNLTLALTLLSIAAVIVLLPLILKILTLPIEFNASRRALKYLKDNNILTATELRGAKRVLNAAAMTYVGSVFDF